MANAKPASRWSIWLPLALCTALFVLLSAAQRRKLNPELARREFVERGLLRELDSGTLALQSCSEEGDASQQELIRSCTSLHGPAPLRLPAAREITELLRGTARGASTAFLRLPLDEATRKWADGLETVVLVLPRSTQRTLRVRVGLSAPQYSVGAGANVEIPFAGWRLAEVGELTLEYQIADLDSFGPTDSPPLLVHPAVVGEAQALLERQLSANSLSQQLGVGFPVIVAAVAGILDHSPAFRLLALYGTARAARTFLPSLAEGAAERDPRWNAAYFLSNAAAGILLICYAYAASGRRPGKRLKNAAFAGSACAAAGFVALGLRRPELAASIDLWVDVISGAAAAACLVPFPGRGTRLSFGQGLMLAALALHVFVNGSDLFQLERGGFKDVVDWRHALLFPMLITAGLIEVGSTSTRLRAAARDSARKAFLERDLSFGSEIQGRMLPVRRGAFGALRYRALYLPASGLAGDWFDIRILRFADGRSLVAACVSDVTGHGVASSLSTGVMSAFWAQWCDEAAEGILPEHGVAREELLRAAPYHLDRGLGFLRRNEAATALCVLIDPDSRELTYVSAGHPGVLACGVQGGFRYLSSVGPSLGLRSRPQDWTAASALLPEGFEVALITDGLCPQGMGLNRWLARLKKGQDGKGLWLGKELFRQARANRAEYRKSPAAADDVTVLYLFEKPEEEKKS